MVIVKGWLNIEGAISVDANVAATNPNYAPNRWEYKNNCQRCIPAWEMRMRGYDVIAKPAIFPPEVDEIHKHVYNIFKGMELKDCAAGGIEDVNRYMRAWGNGSRAELFIRWTNNSGVLIGAHILAVVQENGHTRFIDPQNGVTDVLGWLAGKKIAELQLDNLQVSNYILDCVEAVK